MKVAVVIPVGPGRIENLCAVMECLRVQTRRPDLVMVIFDGRDAAPPEPLQVGGNFPTYLYAASKHEPGLEQPRNIGTRLAIDADPELTHVAFLDSDILVESTWLAELEAGLEQGPELRILVGPYDWMAPGIRDPQPSLQNDPRWAMFRQHGPDHVYRNDLSAGLACFSGNLLWPIGEFMRVGGFWSEIHHGRCEDGELGLRAVAMDVPISMCAAARGWHMHHAVNTALAVQRNQRDVPMLNERHPWVEGAAVFMVDRDGKAFDVICSKCQKFVPTVEWWSHAPLCGVSTALPVA